MRCLASTIAIGIAALIRIQSVSCTIPIADKAACAAGYYAAVHAVQIRECIVYQNIQYAEYLAHALYAPLTTLLLLKMLDVVWKRREA